MASPSGASGQFASEAARDYSALVSSSSPSSHSSYSDDGQREIDQNDPNLYHHQDNAQDPVCPWRNPRFHHQECSRYFDCPSHTIERSLSESGSGDQESTYSSHHSRTDVERDQSGAQTIRFSNQELAQVGITRDNVPAPDSDHENVDRDAAYITSDPPSNQAISPPTVAQGSGQSSIESKAQPTLNRTKLTRGSTSAHNSIPRKNGCAIAISKTFGRGTSTTSALCSPVNIFRSATPKVAAG
ncbi:hypothetical protein LB505_011254 [Fusarium chuoi]|nr:hypothetical protein LB505_011254 [Fusarium chuoi]